MPSPELEFKLTGHGLSTKLPRMLNADHTIPPGSFSFAEHTQLV